ncbi:MAG TPA: hypothetical protein PLQ32_04270 [Flavihumibacter sp.]|nr:hypothetical protein [Bacteroidota bacterium]HPZ87296.1 hypothetical protein [Flavihumibacter sp.]HQD08019.1 hypothetical protein [Flavihumibacter sp.]
MFHKNERKTAIKRPGFIPREVYPVRFENLLLTAPVNRMGRIVALDAANGKPIWSVLLYRIMYNPHLPEDLQHDHITEMLIKDRQLFLRTEKDHFFQLDLDSKIAKPLMH